MPDFHAFSGYTFLQLSTPSGHGSGSANIRYLTVEDYYVGNGLTYVTNSTNGTAVTVVRAGILLGIRSDASSAGAVGFAMSINSNQLTTNQVSITQAHRLGTGFSALANVQTPICFMRYVAASDVIRPHDNGTKPNSTGIDSNLALLLLEF